MTKQKKLIKLPAEVSEKYAVANAISGKFVDATYGEVDLYNITLKKADKLVAAGFPYLKAKSNSKTKVD